MNSLKIAFTGLTMLCAATAATAQDWAVDSAASSVAFGSIKKDTAGESHVFTTVSGNIERGGAATITVDLTSVNTNIDIRNERIVEHVFHNMAAASVTAQIDIETLEMLAVGEMTAITLDATLSFMGAEVGFDAPMIAIRLSETRAMVVSDGMVFISTADMGIDAGIDMLMELASLPGITRTVPITARLVFDLQE